MSKIELPPLPRPIYAASCGKDPFYTADHIRADRRQIVELCASLCDARLEPAKEEELCTRSRALAGKDGELETLKFWQTVRTYNAAIRACAAAIRALLDEKKGDE